MIREIFALYGRKGLGSLALAVEPLFFAVPVLFLWSSVRAPFTHNIPMIEMLWSGYMPVLLFRHVGGRMLSFVEHNVGLMYHRNVTLLDVAIARMAVEIISNYTAAVIMFIIFYLIGTLKAPFDPPLLFLGYFYQTWWCVAVGLVVGSLSTRSEWVAKFWTPFSYTYMFWSGFPFLVEWLPSRWQYFALFLPSVEGYEILRSGLLGPRIMSYYNFGYETFALTVLTFIGLSMLGSGRRFIVAS